MTDFPITVLACETGEPDCTCFACEMIERIRREAREKADEARLAEEKKRDTIRQQLEWQQLQEKYHDE